mmetsp:Transcript_16680/g.34802  ORF Transcript_16680/g.34802 Transcript_16680/m.34802 type:complete len:290 (-) Transcript_16680:89-958(-)
MLCYAMLCSIDPRRLQQGLSIDEFLSRLIRVPFPVAQPRDVVVVVAGLAVLDSSIGVPIHVPNVAFVQQPLEGGTRLAWLRLCVCFVFVFQRQRVCVRLRSYSCSCSCSPGPHVLEYGSHRVPGIPNVGPDNARGTPLEPSRDVQRCQRGVVVGSGTTIAITNAVTDAHPPVIVPECSLPEIKVFPGALVDRQALVADADQAQVGLQALVFVFVFVAASACGSACTCILSACIFLALLRFTGSDAAASFFFRLLETFGCFPPLLLLVPPPNKPIVCVYICTNMYICMYE